MAATTGCAGGLSPLALEYITFFFRCIVQQGKERDDCRSENEMNTMSGSPRNGTVR